jgi:hypothetical protein
MKVRYDWDEASSLPKIQLIAEDSADRMILAALDGVELRATAFTGQVDQEPRKGFGDNKVEAVTDAWLKPTNISEP